MTRSSRIPHKDSKSVRVQDLEQNEDRHGRIGGRRQPINMDDQDKEYGDTVDDEIEVAPIDNGDPRELTDIFPS